MRLGWSVSRLAHALGLHHSVVSRTLRGESRNPATQALIAMFAGQSPRDLFGDHCAPSIRNLRAPKSTSRKGASHAA
jgi:transcriptional regulator with XRE-family HTH domain